MGFLEKNSKTTNDRQIQIHVHVAVVFEVTVCVISLEKKICHKYTELSGVDTL